MEKLSTRLWTIAMLTIAMLTIASCSSEDEEIPTAGTTIVKGAKITIVYAVKYEEQNTKTEDEKLTDKEDDKKEESNKNDN